MLLFTVCLVPQQTALIIRDRGQLTIVAAEIRATKDFFLQALGQIVVWCLRGFPCV